MLEEERKRLIAAQQKEISLLKSEQDLYPTFGDGILHGRRLDVVYDRISAFFDLHVDITTFYQRGWISSIASLAGNLRSSIRKDKSRSSTSEPPRKDLIVGGATQVPSLVGVKQIGMIAAGETHTVIVDDLSTVYTFGFGDIGQLGHGPKQTNVAVPTEVENLKKTIESYELSYKSEKKSVGQSKINIPRDSLSYRRT
jgi:hypothetical protein